MSASSLRILFLEDRVTDVLLIRHALKTAGISHEAHIVETETALKKALAQGKWDIVLSDYCMPELMAPDALRIVREFDENLPFILVSGSIGDETAVAMMKSGAQDYVLKENLVRLPTAVLRELSEAEGRRARKRAERALRLSEERFRRLSASSPVGIYEADVDGRVRYCNPRLQQMWRMSEAEIRERGWTERVHPDDLPGLLTGWVEANKRGVPFDLEYRLMLPDGELRWIHGRSEVLRDATGEVSGAIGTVDDITERKKAEEAVRRTEKLAAVGQLASTIAHEINNPLEAVTNLVYLAETDPTLGASSRRYLADAQQELHRVAQIVTQTLQFNRRRTERTAANLESIIDSALSLFGRRFEEQHIAVERDVSGSYDLLCYPSDLRQVFVNLIGNALDAMAGRQGLLRIHLYRQARSSDGVARIRVSIADTGVGMDRAVMERVFDAFFTTKGDKGSGLGLWVTGEIVKRHGGTIQLRSCSHPERSGTTVSLTFPVYEGEDANSRISG